MKIAMIGTGYVGLVSGVCFSDFGHEVVCVDKNPQKVEMLERGEVPIYEPGLDRLMAKNVEAGRLSFTGDLKTAVDGADAVFIAVGTPTRRGDGHADLSYVFAAAEEIADAITGYTVVVTKSTVPVGTNARVEEIVRKARPEAEFDVASNPEFLREGAAIDDFMRPDRVVVGVSSDRAAQVMADIYRPLYLRDAPVVITDIASAEMIKYAANAFLATKITFINEIAMLCERTGADVKEVSKGIGLDGRIGNKFLHAGPGYGGSCFPKDTSALARIGQEHGVPMRITEAVIAVNDHVRRRMIDKVLDLARRVGQRQDGPGARRHLQAQHRRHARRAGADHRPRPRRRRRQGARGRPPGPARGRAPAARRRLGRRPLRRGRGRPCGGHPDRVERVPSPRPRPPRRRHGDAPHGRPAQRLRPRGRPHGRLRGLRRRRPLNLAPVLGLPL